MSEKRKPLVKIFACVGGKRWRVELFPRQSFPRHSRVRLVGNYRVRINGKWSGGRELRFHDLSFVMAELRKSIHRASARARQEARVRACRERQNARS